MRRTDITPTGVERTFRDDQIIVSKTDPQGRLTYVNRLFMEISAFEEADLIGQPHNVIRHPDMPRTIFGLLWERIRSGQEVFAYVVNLAHDGAHYWVLAHVTPTFDEAGRIVGHHSTRRSVMASKAARFAALYRDLCAAEAQHANIHDAVAAGRALLDARLAETGTTYDELVWSVINAEVAA